ncbi:MAG: hypothetical protein M1837_000741 [Sclerophora amabilis]|nr:MAG: hypothetical protein M1837_000741 [Sclerophora amabilis]
MAAQAELSAYFKKQQAAGAVVTTEPPKFDLDAYVSNYVGRTRFDRLFTIGTSSSFLSVDALKAAVAEAKRGKDVERYLAAVETLRQITPNDPEVNPDTTWVEKTSKQVKAETDRLEFELKGYKNNLIKESIRMGNEDLGAHYHAIGELGQAFRALSRMRDHCTSPKHILEMYLKLIIVAVEQGNWIAVQSNAMKIGNLQLKPDDEAEVQPKLHASMGLAQLASRNYRDAAFNFLRTEPALGSSFSRVISPNDVAVYGGICALASMDRNELQTEVLENSAFRTFLELEPQIRRAITFFCNSKYSHCLEILEAYKTDYLLDINLQRHIPDLYSAVRSKSIVQYFIPFSCVTLDSMAQAFATKEGSIEDELVSMIEQGTLEARIDTQNKLLTSKQTDTRAAVHRETLAIAKTYEQNARIHLMKMITINAGLEILAPKNNQGMYGGAGGGILNNGPGMSRGGLRPSAGNV